MTTQSFANFTNQATSEARIQNLVNLARQGGEGSAQAYEILKTIPGGLGRIYTPQPSDAPQPTGIPQPVLPEQPAPLPPAAAVDPSWFDRTIGRGLGAIGRTIAPAFDPANALIPQAWVENLPAWTDRPILEDVLPFDLTTREIASAGQQLTTPGDLAITAGIAAAPFLAPAAVSARAAALAARAPMLARAGRVARAPFTPLTGGTFREARRAGFPGFAQRFAAEQLLGLGGITGAREVSQALEGKDVPGWVGTTLPIAGALGGGGATLAGLGAGRAAVGARRGGQRRRRLEGIREERRGAAFDRLIRSLSKPHPTTQAIKDWRRRAAFEGGEAGYERAVRLRRIQEEGLINPEGVTSNAAEEASMRQTSPFLDGVSARLRVLREILGEGARPSTFARRAIQLSRGAHATAENEIQVIKNDLNGLLARVRAYKDPLLVRESGQKKGKTVVFNTPESKHRALKINILLHEPVEARAAKVPPTPQPNAGKDTLPPIENVEIPLEPSSAGWANYVSPGALPDGKVLFARGDLKKFYDGDPLSDGTKGLTPEERSVVDRLRMLTDQTEADRLDMHPDLATVDHYFDRSWKPPEGMELARRDSSGKIISRYEGRASYQRGRVPYTYEEMLTQGYEPLYVNPVEQAGHSALKTKREYEQQTFLKVLKDYGDEFVQPVEGQVVKPGWRVPEIGKTFEGSPYFARDAQGKVVQSDAGRYMVPDDIADRLENVYGGPRPKFGKILGSDKELADAIDWLTFVPKRAKLVMSFFQDNDFLMRLGIGSWTRAVDELFFRRNPREAVLALARYPQAATFVLKARFSAKNRAELLKRMADKDAPTIIKGREINERFIIQHGLNTTDQTILPPDIDKMVDDIARSTGAMGRIKGLARSVKDFEVAFRQGLFEGTYPATMFADIRYNIGPMLAKMHPDLTDAQLATRISDLVNTKYSTIPPEMSVVQNRNLRYGLTRLMFSLGESEGLLRQATGTVTGQDKEFWTKHWIGAYVFLITTAGALHFMTTGEALPKERYTPISKDNWGPLPFGYSTQFANPDLPGTGQYDTTARLDLVGQMDTAFRVLNPQMFVTSRFSVPTRALINQLNGTNFFGEPIDDLGPGGVSSRTAQLAIDMFSPIGTGKLGERFARDIPGFEDYIPSDASGLNLKGITAETLGFNLRNNLRKNLLEQVSQEQFQKPLDDLTQLELFRLKADPDLRNKLQEIDVIKTGQGDKFARYRLEKASARRRTEIHTESNVKYLMQELLSPDFDPKDTRKTLKAFSTAVSRLENEEYVRVDQYKKDNELDSWTGEEPTNDFDRMLNEWYALYDLPQYKKAGSLNWDKLRFAQESFIAGLSPELAEQLIEWRARNDIKGIESLRNILGPIRVENKDVYLNNDNLLSAIKYVFTDENVGFGYSAEDISNIMAFPAEEDLPPEEIAN